MRFKHGARVYQAISSFFSPPIRHHRSHHCHSRGASTSLFSVSLSMSSSLPASVPMPPPSNFIPHSRLPPHPFHFSQTSPLFSAPHPLLQCLQPSNPLLLEPFLDPSPHDLSPRPNHPPLHDDMPHYWLLQNIQHSSRYSPSTAPSTVPSHRSLLLSSSTHTLDLIVQPLPSYTVASVPHTHAFSRGETRKATYSPPHRETSKKYRGEARATRSSSYSIPSLPFCRCQSLLSPLPAPRSA